MRQPNSTAAARFNARLKRSKQKLRSGFSHRGNQPTELPSMTGERVGYESKQQHLQQESTNASKSVDQYAVLGRIVESEEEDCDSPKNNDDACQAGRVPETADGSPFSASPMAVVFTDGENPFRSNNNTESSSPTHVQDFADCYQPKLSSEAIQGRCEMDLQPRNLCASGLLNDKRQIPSAPSFEQRTLMPNHDDDENFVDALQDQDQTQDLLDGGDSEQFSNARQDLPECTMMETNIVTKEAADDDRSNSVSAFRTKTSINTITSSQDESEETAYEWSSIKSKILHSFRSNTAYIHEQFIACQQPCDVGDSTVTLFGTKEEGIDDIASSFQSLRRSFSLEMPTNPFWDGEFPDKPQANNGRAQMKTNRQVPTQGQSDVLAMQDDSTAKVVLYIDHYGPSTFFRLMKELKNNDRVKELHIFRSWDNEIKRTRNKADICILFDAIRTLPKLGHLALSNFLPHELDTVTEAQWHNTHLCSLRIHVCKGALSKGLLKTLSGIPQLCNLALEVCQSSPFHYILENKRLKTLSLEGTDYIWKHEHIMELVYVLRKTFTLKRLLLEPPMNAKTFKFLAYGLIANTGVEDLKVHVLPGHSPVETNEALQEFSRTLVVNTTLKSAWNTNYDALKVNEQVSKKLLDAFAKNDAIQKFLMFDEEPAFHCAKETLLKDNRRNSVPILPDLYIPGCATVKSLQQVVTAKDPHNDNMSLVDSVAMDYADIGSSISRLGDVMVEFGKNMFGLFLDTAAVIGQAAVSKAPPSCDVDVLADRLTAN
ncbi:hypothetical protein IV203_026044 [Nitzschia inconspicua]|uniref:UvrC family homology region profile domain-containing protein n=1 Tax=Nitzschia inconspicua TaxID=303405 RepID=A0A9K3K6S8_9STRA|nr:hypothetical protein IV203_009445 [Nitzschia inconspicua]KAG7362684.1 hypothetical protein IV203_026044 [Nitzschia inconspicua]